MAHLCARIIALQYEPETGLSNAREQVLWRLTAEVAWSKSDSSDFGAVAFCKFSADIIRRLGQSGDDSYYSGACLTFFTLVRSG